MSDIIRIIGADTALRSAVVTIAEIDGIVKVNGEFLLIPFVRYPNFMDEDSEIWLGWWEGKQITLEPLKDVVFINGQKHFADCAVLRQDIKNKKDSLS